MVLKSLLFDHLRYSEHLEKDTPNTHKHRTRVCELLSSPFLQHRSLYLLTFLSPRGLYPLLYPQVSRPTFWGASRITWGVALPSVFSSLVHFFPLWGTIWIQSHSPSSLLNLHSPREVQPCMCAHLWQRLSWPAVTITQQSLPSHYWL